MGYTKSKGAKGMKKYRISFVQIKHMVFND